MVPKLITILEALKERSHPDGEYCVPFKPIMEETGFDRRTVRLGVRRLARNGFAQYWRGLCTDEGEFAGAGYCITRAGVAFLEQNGKDQCSL